VGLYLRASAAAFRVGNVTVWQIQFAQGPPVALPLTRDYLYRNPTADLATTS
jgi:hypothetical protein